MEPCGSKLYFDAFPAADIIIDLTLHTHGGINIFILVKCDNLVSTVCSQQGLEGSRSEARVV